MSILFHNILGDYRGKLIALESQNHIPFNIKRVFYIYDIPKNVSRGKHSHYKTKQYLKWMQLLCSFYPNLEYRTQLCNMYVTFYNRAVKMIKKKYIGMMSSKYKMRLMSRRK